MRITWFGNRCVRINFSSHSFVFYAHEAVGEVANAELIGDAVLIDDDQTGPFEPLLTQKPAAARGRLIDAMDEPEKYFCGDKSIVMDALPDERLVIRFCGMGSADHLDAWFEGAVVLIVGEYEQCLRMIDENNLAQARQLVLAISDFGAVNMSMLAIACPGIPIQLLENGLALEL